MSKLIFKNHKHKGLTFKEINLKSGWYKRIDVEALSTVFYKPLFSPILLFGISKEYGTLDYLGEAHEENFSIYARFIEIEVDIIIMEK